MKTVRNRAAQRRDDRRRRVAELFRQGLFLKEIAKRVGACVNTVSSDVAALHGDWLGAAASHYRDAMVQQLQKLMLAEDEAWGAWLASKEPSVVERDEVKSGVDGDTRRHLRTVRHQCGNAGYIRAVLRCVEIRCRLLGLYAKEGQPNTPPENQLGPLELRDVLKDMTDAELQVLSGPFQKYRQQLMRGHGLDKDAQPMPCCGAAPPPMDLGGR